MKIWIFDFQMRPEKFNIKNDIEALYVIIYDTMASLQLYSTIFVKMGEK